MAFRCPWRQQVLGIMLFIFLSVGRSEQFSISPSATANAVSELTDSIVRSMGWNAEEVKIVDVDKLEPMFGHATLYEFDVQIGKGVIPLRLSEEVKSWKFLEESTEVIGGEPENGLMKEAEQFAPVLSPFQLAGPLELWIHDADHMRLSVPHDVEAGILKKVMLADGAVVTVVGARELSLRQPIQLPLPISTATEDGNLALNLIELATKLRRDSSNQEKPVSLRIVGPTSLAASSINEPDSTSSKLKVKRLAPGSVELRSRQEQGMQTPVSLEVDANSLGPNDMWMWPLPSLNGSDPKLRGIEELLRAILGPNAQQKGTIKLLKAQAAAATFVKVQFELEKKAGNDTFNMETWPEWRTKSSVVRLQFELTGNVTFSKIPLGYPPVSPFTL
ncbi:hypothetical protein SUGI_1186420 [Cryptomeria japonica]|nr:hypothetical protein SUGI_1186420 [Cryptomeria japonica]